MTTTRLEVRGMTCQGCVRHVREALEAVPGVEAVEVSLEEGAAVVRRSAGEARAVELVEAVEAAGYSARSVPGDGGSPSPDWTAAPGPSVAPEPPADADSGGDDRPHLLVIGGGSGAFAAAIRASELGARVTVVERGVMGGTCVNRGCVPSKTLIRAAEVAHLRSRHPFDGIPSGDVAVELGPLVAQKRELVERLRGTKYRDVLTAYPSVEYAEGEARFTGPGEVEVALADGGVRALRPGRIVVATGARPWIPDLPGLDGVEVWTNEEALEADEVPERLVVAGAGPVGVELAQLFSRLGSRVTLVAPELVPGADRDLAAALAGCLADEGLEVVTGARITGVREEDGGKAATASVRGRERSFPFDRLLLATGRSANTESLRAGAAGIETVGRGFIPVDDGLRTEAEGIYAVGDCTDRPHFVYVAAKAGTIAAENALGGADRALDLSAMPAVIFSDPQLAWVGLTEEEARGREEEVEIRSLGMEHVPRALANRDTRGLIKLVARRGDGRILGVHVLSPQAAEVIQAGVLAVKHGLTVGELADNLFPYLTEVEGLKLAAQSFTKEVEMLSCCAG